MILAEAIGSAGDWKEFGLAGLVIFALMTIVIGVVVTGVKTVAGQISDHRNERKEWADRMDAREQTHASERDSWGQRIDSRDDKLDLALERLTDAIRERTV